MDTAALTAAFQAHKGPILAAGAAGVAGLAYYRKKKTAAAGTSSAAGASSASAGGQTATMAGMNGAAPYDSSSSDVYGLLQPQLESLGGQLTDLQSRMNAVPVSAAPAPTPTPVGSTVNATPGSTPAGSTPTPVPSAASSYIVHANNAAGGTATAGPNGRIDSTTTNPALQSYVTYATSPNTTGLMSLQSLPQNGSAGPVGSLIQQNGATYKVTGYTFNGAPDMHLATSDGRLIGFDGKPM